MNAIPASCPDCGATLGGRESCQELWDEISARAYTDPTYARTFNLAFDAYCMQHPRYTHSAKSYAAHLMRLCCGLEFNGSPAVYAAIQRWLDGPVELPKPAPPPSVGSMTVADLLAARSGREHHHLALAWAMDVWAAYEAQHDLARDWINQALASSSMR